MAQEVRSAADGGLARARKEDMNAAIEALEPAASPRLHIFLATSDLHLKHKLHMTREQALETIAAMVTLARNSVAGSGIFRRRLEPQTDIDFLAKLYRAAATAGATILNLPDTVGYAMPEEYGADVSESARGARRCVQGTALSAHCHDDLGMAVANSLAAVARGSAADGMHH